MRRAKAAARGKAKQRLHGQMRRIPGGAQLLASEPVRLPTK
jgi:hypothetical protein